MTELILVGSLCTYFMIADRFSGGGAGWERLGRDNGGPLPGHPIMYAGSLIVLVALLLGARWLAVAGAVWMLYRDLPWKIDGRSATTPSFTLLGILTALARHSVVPFVLLAITCVVPHSYSAPVLFIYPVVATGLGLYVTKSLPRDVNPLVELLRGGIFGIVLAISLALG